MFLFSPLAKDPLARYRSPFLNSFLIKVISNQKIIEYLMNVISNRNHFKIFGIAHHYSKVKTAEVRVTCTAHDFKILNRRSLKVMENSWSQCSMLYQPLPKFCLLLCSALLAIVMIQEYLCFNVSRCSQESSRVWKQ